MNTSDIPSSGPWLPDAISQAGQFADPVFDRVYALGILAFLVIVFPFMVKVFRNWKRTTLEGQVAQPEDHVILQSVVFLFPLLFLSGIYFVGAKGFASQNVEPSASMEIYVDQTEEGWQWTYREDSQKVPLSTNAIVGKKEAADGKKPLEATVPSETPVKLILSAKTDTHFSIPNMRVKTDISKGETASVWFEASETAAAHGYPYLAVSRDDNNQVVKSQGAMHVVAADSFDTWVREASGGPTVARGEGVYNRICVACHSVDGSRKVGPTFQALWGRSSPLESGGTVIVDEAYFRKSMLQPNADIVKGYAAAMPVQALPEADVKSLIMFIQNIPTSGGAAAAAPVEDPTATSEPSIENGKTLYTNVCAACHSTDGSKRVGPSFAGIWGRESQLESGKTAIVDEAYFKTSVLEPNKDIVKGYPAAMPAQNYNDNQLQSLIMYLKTLK